ncbi:hypothetical protein ACEN3H_12705 [Acinetobacter lactucae]
MDFFKFLKSFNTIGTYLLLSTILLIILIIWFYIIDPKA